MTRWKGFSIEVKGLIAGLAAAGAVLAAAFGVSALVRPRRAALPAPISAVPTPFNSAQDSQAGRRIFTARCASCHGANAEGSMGPKLHNLDIDAVQIARVVRTGFPGKMPAFGARLNGREQKEVVAYVDSLRDATTKTRTPNAAP